MKASVSRYDACIHTRARVPTHAHRVGRATASITHLTHTLHPLLLESPGDVMSTRVSARALLLR